MDSEHLSTMFIIVFYLKFLPITPIFLSSLEAVFLTLPFGINYHFPSGNISFPIMWRHFTDPLSIPPHCRPLSLQHIQPAKSTLGWSHCPSPTCLQPDEHYERKSH